MTRPASPSGTMELAELEARARELAAMPGPTPPEKLAGAGALRAALAHWESATKGDAASADSFAKLEARVEELSRAGAELGGAEELAALDALALAALEARARVLEHELRSAPERSFIPTELRRIAGALAGGLARAARLAARAREDRAQRAAAQVRARLRTVARSFDEALLAAVRQRARRAPARAADLLHDATREVVDAAQDQYAALEDYPLPESIAVAEAAAERLALFRATLAEVNDISDERRTQRADPTGRRRPLREVRRSLERTARELEVERDEKVLALRLEQRYGPRFVLVLENLVSALILAVLVVFGIELACDLSEGAQRALLWIDTAICALFLAELGLRLAHAPRKLRYLRRHALVDLLPSIPYGLLVEWLSSATALRALRFLRLARLARYVRVARPLVRLLRAFLFALRGLDRLVRRNAAILNRALLFASDPPPLPAEESAELRAARLGRALRRREVEALHELAAGERRTWIDARAAELRAELAQFDPAAMRAPAEEPPPRELPVEHAIAHLAALDAARVLDALGPQRTRELARAIGALRVRPIRWLPGPRGLVRDIPANAEPAEVVACFGRALGSKLARFHRALTWFRDLHGTLTGPQLLDKVGTTFVRASAQPARRLIAFGGSFVILAGLATLLELEILGNAMRFVARFLGVPILILGGVALAFFLFGSWLRRVAGSATEYFSTVADAHFLRLTSLVKEHRAREDARFLFERAVRPEHELAELAGDTLDAGAQARLAARAETLEQMHRDYLRTPPLHPSDVRLSSFLLGNLALQGLLAGTLHLDRRERRSLRALDLSKTGLFGPRLWFHFITSAIGQRAARLVVDYNRHCLSKEDVAHAAPLQREVFDAWLEARSAGLPLEEVELALAPPAREADENSIVGEPLLADDRAQRALLARLREGTWASAHFDALHFLSRDPKRERAVQERFGSEVLACQREDRRRLIREVFGTHPMSGLTREQLAFNPYRFYWRWLDNGKIVIAPLVLLWFALRTSGAALRSFAKLCREVLRPSLTPNAEETARCRFDIALRKIHRMRKPLYLTALELRARFDLELHGLPWPGIERPAIPVGTLDEDLRFIEAGAEFSARVKRWGEGHARALADLDAFLAERDMRLRDLGTLLRERGAPDWRERGEQIRAATLAYLADEGRVRSLVGALELEKRRDLRHPTREQRRAFRLLARFRQTGDPGEHVLRTLVRAAAQSDLWSERLFALRSVQSLAVLDLDVTQDLVWELGDFESDGEVRRVAEPRGLLGSRAAHVPRSVDEARAGGVPGACAEDLAPRRSDAGD
ncbi:MAG: ion transporter [Planctomycetes bacterium]|nr:ion transporter [Planctomycetota bacterium]